MEKEGFGTFQIMEKEGFDTFQSLQIRKTVTLRKNLTTSFSLYHGLVVRERAGRHWWVKNTGFKLVVGKINFRSKKIGGSRKVNWWVRNFCPTLQESTVGLG
jgi:hypothetical protein